MTECRIIPNEIDAGAYVFGFWGKSYGATYRNILVVSVH